MLKKFLIVLLVLLTACEKQAENIEIEDVYVDPARDVFLFNELDANTRVAIKKANGNKDYSNAEFKMLGKDIYQGDLNDINGNTVNLNDYDKVVVEVVSVECGHCMTFIQEHIDEMLEHDVQLIQYFNIGKPDTITSFYDDLGIDIPENIIILESDVGMHEYIKNDLGVETYPTLLSYVDGKLSFVGSGEYDSETIDDFYDISFENRLDELKDKDGNDLLSLLRDTDEVKNSLSIDNQNKIASIDNDQSTIDATYKIMGTTCDFTKISNDKSDIYINEIDDFSVYEDKNLVLLYTYFRSEEDVDKVEFINSLVNSNDDYEYIVVLIEGLESSSSAYQKMTTKLACPCVSVLGYIPEDFYKIGLTAYPSAFFIRKGTFTGAYSNIENIDKFNIALDIFLSDNCVALLRNN